MDTLDRFRRVTANITQRFQQLQRAAAAKDEASLQCFDDLVRKLELALLEADRYVVTDGAMFVTTNCYTRALELAKLHNAQVSDILTKY
jgi:hypothetical protein